jgi:hypothetical protein
MLLSPRTVLRRHRVVSTPSPSGYPRLLRVVPQSPTVKYLTPAEGGREGVANRRASAREGGSGDGGERIAGFSAQSVLYGTGALYGTGPRSAGYI